MKIKFLFYSLLLLSIGCSKEDDCEAKKQAIRDQYESMIAIAEANYAENGGSHEQVDLLILEYQNRLENACK